MSIFDVFFGAAMGFCMCMGYLAHGRAMRAMFRCGFYTGVGYVTGTLRKEIHPENEETEPAYRMRIAPLVRASNVLRSTCTEACERELTSLFERVKKPTR
jgi:hypothetical protein